VSRNLKEPEIRRKEIIDAAYLLFEEKGYENTSVENIINAASIAKGTFYYYFKAKKDLLNEISNEISQKIHSLIQEVSTSQSLSVAEKLNCIFTSPEKNIIINSNIMTAIHNAENRELQEKLNIYYIKDIVPLITDVFNQGFDENLWSKKVSLQNMQIILGGTQFILDSGLFTWNNQQRKEFFLEVEKLLECLLDVESGTFRTIFKKL
jgi:AcrR family transcriptional regulator